MKRQISKQGKDKNESLSVVHDLKLTQGWFKDDYKRWKNKNMVKELYFRSKIKEIKAKLLQYELFSCTTNASV